MYNVVEEVIDDILIKKIKIETKDLKVVLLSYGAVIMDLQSKNCQGEFESVVLGYENTAEYLENKGCFGANVGRVAGRINKGEFTLNGNSYSVDTNSNGNCLHGGYNGINKRNFSTMYVEEKDSLNVIFTTVQKQEYDHFPGDLNLKITYKISKIEGSIKIIYDAVSNKDTLVNLTNHSYFNLRGNYDALILDETLKIDADTFFEEDNNMIPSKVLPVTKVMDFREEKEIGSDIEDSYLINHSANGYDHYFRFNERDSDKPQIILTDNFSKRKLSISTTYPGVVMYSFNYPNKEKIMNYNVVEEKHIGVALECQYAPDSINNKFFEEGILKANEEFHEEICYKFEVFC